MFGSNLGNTEVPEVLVWQGVCPCVAVGHDSSALQIPYHYILGRENVRADYKSCAGML